MLKPTVFILLAAIAFSSCDRLLMREERQEIDKINLRGLLDTLYRQVDRANPLLIKTASLNGKRDSTAIHLKDTSEWQREFENFSDLKLRPGRLLSQYDEKQTSTPDGIRYFYTAKGFEKEPLDSFLVEMDRDENIRLIKAYINSQNFFISNEKMMILSFSDIEGKMLPDKYMLEGWQKVKTKDTLQFKINATIEY